MNRIHQLASLRMIVAVVAGASGICQLSPDAFAFPYSYESIVQNQGDPFNFFSVYSAQPLNDAGEVAFFATSSTFGSGDMYKSSGGGDFNFAHISTNPNHFVNSTYTGSINDAGRVAIFSKCHRRRLSTRASASSKSAHDVLNHTPSFVRHPQPAPVGVRHRIVIALCPNFERAATCRQTE